MPRAGGRRYQVLARPWIRALGGRKLRCAVPRVVRFECESLAIVDWHCPGDVVGPGTEERSPAYEVSIGRVGGHFCRFPDGEISADTAGLLLVNAGEPFRPIRRSRGLDRRTLIRLSERTVRELAGGGAARFPRRYLPLSARAALAHHALVDGATDPLAVHELALAIAGEAFDGSWAPRPVTRLIRDAVHTVRETLAVRYSERLLLDDLAGAVSLSPSHLSRSFHSVIGVRLHRYLTRVRLMAALERMRGEDRPELTAIALDVGFSSHSHMTTAFRQFFGVPPSRIGARIRKRAAG